MNQEEPGSAILIRVEQYFNISWHNIRLVSHISTSHVQHIAEDYYEYAN